MKRVGSRIFYLRFTASYDTVPANTNGYASGFSGTSPTDFTLNARQRLKIWRVFYQVTPTTPPTFATPLTVNGINVLCFLSDGNGNDWGEQILAPGLTTGMLTGQNGVCAVNQGEPVFEFSPSDVQIFDVSSGGFAPLGPVVSFSFLAQADFNNPDAVNTFALDGTLAVDFSIEQERET